MALVVRLSPPCVSESRLKRGEHTQNIVLHTFCKHIWLVAEIAVTAIFLKDEGKRESEEKSESLHRLIYSCFQLGKTKLLLFFSFFFRWSANQSNIVNILCIQIRIVVRWVCVYVNNITWQAESCTERDSKLTSTLKVMNILHNYIQQHVRLSIMLILYGFMEDSVLPRLLYQQRSAGKQRWWFRRMM